MALAGDLHPAWAAALQEGDGGNNPGPSFYDPYPHSGLDKKKWDDIQDRGTPKSSLIGRRAEPRDTLT